MLQLFQSNVIGFKIHIIMKIRPGEKDVYKYENLYPTAATFIPNANRIDCLSEMGLSFLIVEISVTLFALINGNLCASSECNVFSFYVCVLSLRIDRVDKCEKICL